MTSTITFRLRALVPGFALLFVALGVIAAPAARVEFSIGEVTVQTTDGRVRSLFKGAAIESGDTISTNEGRAQLRFSDGGYVSLYDRSIFRIDDYRWEGESSGGERSFFTLLKGGLRTITGRVAKVNRKAYLMTTVVATIGVRGTEYTMQLNGSLTGAVAEGEIEVCNAGGCVPVAAGQAYLVTDPNTKPKLTRNQTLLQPAQPVARTQPTVDLAASKDGAALNQTLQGVGGATGSALGATIDSLGSTTGGLLDSAVGNAGNGVGRVVGGVTDTAGGLIDSTIGSPSSPVNRVGEPLDTVIPGGGTPPDGLIGLPGGSIPIDPLRR